MSARFDTTVEQIKRNYKTTVSQMRCPHHHKNAWVEVEGERFNTFHIDIVTCCKEFEQRVRKSLLDTREEASAPYGTGSKVTKPL